MKNFFNLTSLPLFSLTYVFADSFAGCTAKVQRGEADIATIWEPYPMPEHENISQVMLFRADKMNILSAYNETKSVSITPNFLVFKTHVILLFFLTVLMVTGLFIARRNLYRQIEPQALVRVRRRTLRRKLTTLYSVIECALVRQPIKGFMMRFKLVALVILVTSFFLVIFYGTNLNTCQVVFNEPHQIKSYAQIEEENIKPLFLSVMNAFSIINSVATHAAEYTIKKVVKMYNPRDLIIDFTETEIELFIKNLYARIELLPQQKTVMIISNEMIQMVKSIFCAFAFQVRSNLRLLSSKDPQATDVNAQMVFGKNFMNSPLGKTTYQFCYQSYATSKVVKKAFGKFSIMSEQFYFLGAATPRQMVQNERECAGNYWQVPYPSVESIKTFEPFIIFFFILVSLVVLIIEVFFKCTLGAYINGFSLSSQKVRVNPRKNKMKRAKKVYHVTTHL